MPASLAALCCLQVSFQPTSLSFRFRFNLIDWPLLVTYVLRPFRPEVFGLRRLVLLFDFAITLRAHNKAYSLLMLIIANRLDVQAAV